MKKLFIVGNWKSYKTKSEAIEWFTQFTNTSLVLADTENKIIILCPPFPLLATLEDLIAKSINNTNLNLKLGCQNVSSFEEGAYTGEVSAKLLSGFCKYVIIGHSERRTNFKETDDQLRRKVELTKRFNMTPIFCIQGKETIIPDGVDVVAYEPVSAIGTGKPDDPIDAEEVAGYVKEKYKVSVVLYGGSVNENDVTSFTNQPHIDGVLVGGASRDAISFTKIIKNA